MPMKLKEGSYENLITNELQQDMNLATDNGLVCRKGQPRLYQVTEIINYNKKKKKLPIY